MPRIDIRKDTSHYKRYTLTKNGIDIGTAYCTDEMIDACAGRVECTYVEIERIPKK